MNWLLMTLYYHWAILIRIITFRTEIKISILAAIFINIDVEFLLQDEIDCGLYISCHLSKKLWLVIMDEADELLSAGFRKDIYSVSLFVTPADSRLNLKNVLNKNQVWSYVLGASLISKISDLLQVSLEI